MQRPLLKLSLERVHWWNACTAEGKYPHKGGKAINIFANRLVMIGIRTAHHQIGRYDIIRVGSHAELFQNGKTAGIRGRNLEGSLPLSSFTSIFLLRTTLRIWRSTPAMESPGIIRKLTVTLARCGSTFAAGLPAPSSRRLWCGSAKRRAGFFHHGEHKGLQ